MASSQSSKSSKSSRFAQSSKSSKSSYSSPSSSSFSSDSSPSSSDSSVSSSVSSSSSMSSDSSLETTYYFSQFLGNSIRIDEECFAHTREIFEKRDIRNLLGVVSGFIDCAECFLSSSSSSSQSSSSSSSQVLAFADCGTPNGDPTLLATFSWTDVDVNKNWLGCTWTNGETKEVFASTYNKYYAATLFPNTVGIPYQGLELWKKRNTALDLLSMYANPLRYFQVTLGTPNVFDYKKWQYQELDLKYSANVRRFWRNQFYFTYGAGPPTGSTKKLYNSVGNPVVVSGAPNPGAFNINQSRLSDNMLNGEMVYANGLRFRWVKGNNW